MKALKIHPLFLLFGIVVTLMGGIKLYAVSLIAVIMHETAHLRVAAFFGYACHDITLMPYGAVLNISGEMETEHAFAIALAGPLVNLLIVCISVAVFWVIPSAYPYLVDFCRANAVIAIINLLPAYPLDGGRIVCACFAGSEKAKKLCTHLTLILGLLSLLAFILSIIFAINISLLVFGCFLIGYYFHYKVQRGIFWRMTVEARQPLYTLYVPASKYGMRRVIVKCGGRKVARFSREEVARILALYPSNTSIQEVLTAENYKQKK